MIPSIDLRACMNRFQDGYRALKDCEDGNPGIVAGSGDSKRCTADVVVYSDAASPTDKSTLIFVIRELCEILAEGNTAVPCAKDPCVLYWLRTICVVEITPTSCVLHTRTMVRDTVYSVKKFMKHVAKVDPPPEWPISKLAAWAADERLKHDLSVSTTPCKIMPYDCSDVDTRMGFILFLEGMKWDKSWGEERARQIHDTMLVYQVVLSASCSTFLINCLPENRVSIHPLHNVDSKLAGFIDDFCTAMLDVFNFKRTTRAATPLGNIVFELASYLAECGIHGTTYAFHWPLAFTEHLEERPEDAARFTLAVAKYTNPEHEWIKSGSTPWLCKIRDGNDRLFCNIYQTGFTGFRIHILHGYNFSMPDIGRPGDIRDMDISQQRKNRGLGDAKGLLRCTMTRLLSVLSLFADHNSFF